MRVCVRCSVEQPLTEFYARRGRSPETRCRSCYRGINRENKRQRQRQRRQARLVEVVPRREIVTGPACRAPGVDPEWFYPVQVMVDLFVGPTPDRNKVESINRQRVSLAKATCARCPVRSICLAEYLDEPFGIFGGLTAQERRSLPPTARPDHAVSRLVG